MTEMTCVRCRQQPATMDSPDDFCEPCWKLWMDGAFSWTRSTFPLHQVQWPATPFELRPQLILLGRCGSEAHGTYVPPEQADSIDDRDLMGIVMPPPRFYLGTHDWQNANGINGPWDVVLYEFRKFIGLLVKQNPNVLGMLWLEPSDYLLISKVGRAILDRRMAFRAREAAFASFTGYARGQLKKMTAGKFEGYMGAKRKALVERFGFDCKNAAHLIRLLHVGEEYLRHGIMQVRRTWDRDMLVEIKRGGWSLARVQEYSAERFRACEEAYEKSALPDAIDLDEVDRFVTATLVHYIKEEE